MKWSGSENVSVAVSSAQNWLEIVYGITFSHEADTGDFNLQTLRTTQDLQYPVANALLSACYYDPFTGSIHIRLSEGATAGSSIEVFDISGRLLFSGRADNGRNEVIIDASALPVSVCHIRITETEGRIENHKLFLGR